MFYEITQNEWIQALCQLNHYIILNVFMRYYTLKMFASILN